MIPPTSAAGGPVVLVLHDEPLLRMALADLIEEAGHQVVEVTSAADAIRMLEARTDIRVVVADLDVRGALMGVKLAAAIRERWPPVELLLTGTVCPDTATMPARGQFFDKPFDQRAFTRALHRLTGISAPRAAL